LDISDCHTKTGTNKNASDYTQAGDKRTYRSGTRCNRTNDRNNEGHVLASDFEG
jgi:hypothetical protein